MRCRKTRLGRFIRRKTSSALICAAGLGAMGCAGGHLDLSSRWPGLGTRTGEEHAVAAADEADRNEADRIERTGLSRVLPFRRAADAADESQESSGGGRVFSAFVNRLPGRRPPASDPFLEKQTAAAGTASTARDPRTPTAGMARTRTPAQGATQPVAARSTGPAVQRERSDAELWQMFNADVAGTANVRGTPQAEASTPTPVAATASRAPVTNDSLPAWAQEQPVQAQPKPQTPNPQTRDLAALVAQTRQPQSQAERAARTRINPSSKPKSVPEAPPITRREADQRLEQLLAEARRQQGQGNLFEAYRVAVIAEELAEREHIVFAPRQERPVDIVREIEQQMQESRSTAEEAPATAAPPSIVKQQPPSGPVAVAMTQAAMPVASVEEPTAGPFADGSWQTQQTRTATAAVRPPVNAQNAGGRFDSEFPALHEWREFRANSPVSLAVRNTATEATDELPVHPVRQALATGDSAMNADQAPLLARAEADRDRMLAAGQGTSLFSGDLRSPGLAAATHPDLQPVSVPAAPPLEVAPPKPPVSAARVGGGHSSGGGLVWWVLGGLAAVAGFVAVRSRQQQPFGRR